MATYTHFGKQPDVFKHLVLCEVLQHEKPQIYVETNSASAIYRMKHTAEQQYGICHFLEKANEEDILRTSTYYKLESTEMSKGHYLGSPALAMEVLGEQAQSFLFFDIEKDALDNVELYAKQINLHTHIQTCNSDSLKGVIELLPSLPKSSFIHIDPYEIDKEGTSGTTYLDVLIKATQSGMKCLLWYGFMTENDQAHINQYITSKLEKEDHTEFLRGFIILFLSLLQKHMNYETFLRFIFPDGMFDYFEMTQFKELPEKVELYFEEKNSVPEEYKNDKLESKGFYEEIRMSDYPMRGRSCILFIKKRRWYNHTKEKYVSRNWKLMAEGTQISFEFASFLKAMDRLARH